MPNNNTDFEYIENLRTTIRILRKRLNDPSPSSNYDIPKLDVAEYIRIVDSLQPRYKQVVAEEILNSGFSLVSTWTGAPLYQSKHYQYLIELLDLNVRHHSELDGLRNTCKQLLKTKLLGLFDGKAHWMGDSIDYADKAFELELTCAITKLYRLHKAGIYV